MGGRRGERGGGSGGGAGGNAGAEEAEVWARCGEDEGGRGAQAETGGEGASAAPPWRAGQRAAGPPPGARGALHPLALAVPPGEAPKAAGGRAGACLQVGPLLLLLVSRCHRGRSDAAAGRARACMQAMSRGLHCSPPLRDPHPAFENSQKAPAMQGLYHFYRGQSGCARRLCAEVSIARHPHAIRNCKGPKRHSRSGSMGSHEWAPATPSDILPVIESFHLPDRLRPRVPHEARFDVERIAAVIELCVQVIIQVGLPPTCMPPPLIAHSHETIPSSALPHALLCVKHLARIRRDTHRTSLLWRCALNTPASTTTHPVAAASMSTHTHRTSLLSAQHTSVHHPSTLLHHPFLLLPPFHFPSPQAGVDLPGLRTVRRTEPVQTTRLGTGRAWVAGLESESASGVSSRGVYKKDEGDVVKAILEMAEMEAVGAEVVWDAGSQGKMRRGEGGWRGLMEEGRRGREEEEGDRDRVERAFERRSDTEADREEKGKVDEEEEEEEGGEDGEEGTEGEGSVREMAEEALREWEGLREGVERVMGKYPVMVCGYCPEVHVGAAGHKVRLCNASKQQWRHGQHGWQPAVLADLLPPVPVYHTRHPSGPPLLHELRPFYGRVPALLELCVQAGAPVPASWRSYFRLDVAIPDVNDVDNAV
ncbi:unnamed protein product [Closterium sp. Naga37s-1]|nr:unnamed protein product [Closterium sp. Naga37s-1]